MTKLVDNPEILWYNTERNSILPHMAKLNLMKEGNYYGKKGQGKRIIIGIESILLLIWDFLLFAILDRMGDYIDYISSFYGVLSLAINVLFAVFAFKGFFTGKESTYKMLRNISIIGIFVGFIFFFLSSSTSLLIWLAVLITTQLGINEERN